MTSKHGIRGSQTPGKRAGAGAVTKNSTTQRIYDSGSETESESEYETDSDSSVDEVPPYTDGSSQLSLMASTSEFSSDNLFHKDSRKHTKFCTSDLISSFTSQHSDITDEFVLPNTSITQSPHVQAMDRNSGPDYCQSPASTFRTQPSSPTWSTGSVESFFSLQINRYSFTNQLEGLQSFNKNSGPWMDARSSNTSVGDTILRNNVEGLPRKNNPTSHQNNFALPLTFPRISEKNMNDKNKKKGACLPEFSCKRPSCHCKFPTCSCKCFSWPSCSSKCLSCSGWSLCCSGWSLSCSGWPSCCRKCQSCSGWSLSCSGWPSCCRKCQSCSGWPRCSLKCFCCSG